MLKRLLLVCLAGSLGQAQDMQAVGDALRNRDFRHAEELARQILLQHPQNAKAKVDLGLALEGENRNEEAILYWEGLKGSKEEGLPTPAQLDVRISLLKGKRIRAVQLTGLSGVEINHESGEVDLVFYAVRDAKRQGVYFLRPLNDPERQYPVELTLRDLPDGSEEAELRTGKDKEQELLTGAQQPDGTLKLEGPEHTLLLHRTPKPGWSVKRVTRYTWQATNIRLLTPIAPSLGGIWNTYLLPAYGFGGALAADDGLVGLFVMTTPVSGAVLFSPFYRDAEGVHPITRAEMRGDFLYPVSIDGTLWPFNLQVTEKDQGARARLVPGKGIPVKAIQAHFTSYDKKVTFTSTFGVALEEILPGASEEDPATPLLGMSGSAVVDSTEAFDLMILPFKGRVLHLPLIGPFERKNEFSSGKARILGAAENLGTSPLAPKASNLSPMGILDGVAVQTQISSPSPSPSLTAIPAKINYAKSFPEGFFSSKPVVALAVANLDRIGSGLIAEAKALGVEWTTVSAEKHYGGKLPQNWIHDRGLDGGMEASFLGFFKKAALVVQDSGGPKQITESLGELDLMFRKLNMQYHTYKQGDPCPTGFDPEAKWDALQLLETHMDRMIRTIEEGLNIPASNS